MRVCCWLPQILNLVLKLSYVPGTAAVLAESRPLTALMTIARRGRARAKLVALRVLRRVLPTLDEGGCVRVDSIAQSAAAPLPDIVSVAGPGEPTVMLWLAQIGAALAAPMYPALAVNKTLVATRGLAVSAVFTAIRGAAGDAVATHDGSFPTSEVIRLVRSLARGSGSDEWATAVGNCVFRRAVQLPRVARNLLAAAKRLSESAGKSGSADELVFATSDEDTFDAVTCLGALAVCGGMVDLLTIGSRVRHRHGDFAGVVVARSGTDVTVIRDGNDSETVVPVRSLEVVPAVPFNAADFEAPDGSVFDHSALVGALVEALEVAQQATAVLGAVAASGDDDDAAPTDAPQPTLPALLLSVVNAAGVRTLHSLVHHAHSAVVLASGGRVPDMLVRLAT